MVFIFSLLLLVGAIFIITVCIPWVIIGEFPYSEIFFQREHKMSTNSAQFSVPEYTKRREQYMYTLEMQKANEPKREFVLWLGDKGLKVRTDGRMEWIERWALSQNPARQVAAPSIRCIWSR